MSDFGDLMIEGLKEREDSDFGGTLTHNGSSYICSIGPVQGGAKLVPAGFAMSAGTVVVVRKGVLPDGLQFKTGQRVTVTNKLGASKALKVSAPGANDLVVAWELNLEDPAQA